MNTITTTAGPLLVLALLGLTLSGCGVSFGLLYEDVSQPPLDFFPGGDGAGIAWDNSLNANQEGRVVSKQGKACARDVLKLVAWGDGSQSAAAAEGGVETIQGVDFEVTAILGILYTESCTIVYGE